MKKVVSALGLFGFLLSSHVLAADAIVAEPIVSPPPPAYDWTGFYFGGHAGYAFNGDTSWTETESAPVFDYNPGDTDSHDMDGFLGGAHVGYNFQNGNFVFGPEVTVGGGSIDRSSVSTFGAEDDNITTSLDVLVTAVARVGYASNNWLFYANGGWAGAQVDMELVDNTGFTGTWGDSTWHNGYTVGAGVEYGRGQAIFGIEYRYMDLGSANHSALTSNGNRGAFDVDVGSMHSVVGRISWKFGAFQ